MQIAVYHTNKGLKGRAQEVNLAEGAWRERRLRRGAFCRGRQKIGCYGRERKLDSGEAVKVRNEMKKASTEIDSGASGFQ